MLKVITQREVQMLLQSGTKAIGPEEIEHAFS
jgi:hypothetical protein